MVLACIGIMCLIHRKKKYNERGKEGAVIDKKTSSNFFHLRAIGMNCAKFCIVSEKLGTKKTFFSFERSGVRN